MLEVTPVRLRAKARPSACAGQRTDQPGNRAFPQEQRANLSPGGAQRAQDADLRPALGDRNREGIVDDEHADEEREHAGDAHGEGVDAEQGFELPSASRRRFDGETWTQQPHQRRLALFQRDALLQRDIDTVEVAAAAEQGLRGVDIHDAEIAAEGLRHAAGLQNAAHGELFAAFHGVEGELAAHRDVIALGKLARQDQGIRLRQKDQRIVDHVLFGVVEIVIAEAAIAGHIHGKDEQFALSREAGVGFGFDHGRGGAHFAQRLHALEHFFREPGIARRDLQLRFAGDALHGVIEGVQYGLVRGLHAHQQRHAEHDSRRGQHGAQQVFAQVGPADQAQQDHRRTSPAMRASRRVTVRAQLSATRGS